MYQTREVVQATCVEGPHRAPEPIRAPPLGPSDSSLGRLASSLLQTSTLNRQVYYTTTSNLSVPTILFNGTYFGNINSVSLVLWRKQIAHLKMFANFFAFILYVRDIIVRCIRSQFFCFVKYSSDIDSCLYIMFILSHPILFWANKKWELNRLTYFSAIFTYWINKVNVFYNTSPYYKIVQEYKLRISY